MLKITKLSDDRVDLEISGKIDAIEMAVALAGLIKQFQDLSGGKILYKISDFSLPTLGAIGVESCACQACSRCSRGSINAPF
ncbi:hypothetical protein [Planktotalea arctica]|uniref:hypothetical protein n=1 Tax=Planktotalea arctica TaxID=1481893 RepID=UPI00111BEF31|nr:hypothetical protein [Planktotalea arctica]